PFGFAFSSDQRWMVHCSVANKLLEYQLWNLDRQICLGKKSVNLDDPLVQRGEILTELRKLGPETLSFNVTLFPTTYSLPGIAPSQVFGPFPYYRVLSPDLFVECDHPSLDPSNSDNEIRSLTPRRLRIWRNKNGELHLIQDRRIVGIAVP